MNGPHHRERAVLERRQRLTACRLAGIRDQRQLARQLGCSQATVCRDLQALDAEFRRQAAADVAAEKGLELARTERLIAGLWAEASRGEPRAVGRVLDLMTHKARLLGLFAPTQVSVDDLRERAPAIAEVLGMDPAEIVAQAEQLLRRQRR
jgi:hypothetical protein